MSARIENPEHDSIVLRLNQLDKLLADIAEHESGSPYTALARKERLGREAIEVMTLIRKQVIP